MIRAKKSLLLLSGASLFLAAACTEPGYVTGNNTNQKTKQGAILGGIIGAGTGAIVSDDKGKGALIGGILGAAGGATIGNALDRQEAELRQQLDNDVQIVNTGDRLILTMPQDILFPVDSFTVASVLRDDLLKVAQSLQAYPDTTVQVVGHTDSDGAASYNQSLSERRANAVADVLASGGVSYGRLRAFGRGEDQPVASNLTPQGKAQNRRVEIVILPNA
ncbi:MULTISPECIES: OmpA family protein [unclassified Roseovarius]|jgi:outer membrane protein OmpA-like peptidoglycan-associated protein|uniref:OmpA family protein n=1 Tax=unclassified Roseovarius TaxID=2614913 RepID=UPI0000687D70|nr:MULTISPECIES: OmpA family protein [unclassified Roseovarius]EAQ24207.1 OmpA domain protein [Roseovarius sp. 217]KJS40679.1 MAG: membrane protein [Roseovarius sp. BRH_c41]